MSKELTFNELTREQYEALRSRVEYLVGEGMRPVAFRAILDHTDGAGIGDLYHFINERTGATLLTVDLNKAVDMLLDELRKNVVGEPKSTMTFAQLIERAQGAADGWPAFFDSEQDAVRSFIERLSVSK